LVTGQGDFEHVDLRPSKATRNQARNSVRKDLAVPLVSPEEAKKKLPTASSCWQAALPAEDTKTRAPYVWLIPDEATPAEMELRLLGKAIEKHRQARKTETDFDGNWAKRELGKMQTRLERHLKKLQIAPPSKGKSTQWTLKVFRQNAAMGAAEQEHRAKAI
ncbi:MAG: hypothetical protein VXZ35_11025, partial [Pseudomonadota bacterium]|nr:hypothetical protein [Pseudomonadota bacterium]